MMLRCVGVRISVPGGPIRNLRGVLVVSGHVSWLDIFAIGAVLPGSFVAKAELMRWPIVAPTGIGGLIGDGGLIGYVAADELPPE